jgi:hypothetical protein
LFELQDGESRGFVAHSPEAGTGLLQAVAHGGEQTALDNPYRGAVDLLGGLDGITVVREQPSASRFNKKGSGRAREAAQVKDIRSMQGDAGVELRRLQEGAQTRESLWKG